MSTSMTLALVALLVGAPAPDLTTLAERSKLSRTGRYDEVVRLCADYPKKYPGRVVCETFGTTPEGRPMLALVASDDGALDAKTVRARRRPVVLVQGGIHAGEIDGKDAGFMALRELLADPKAFSAFTWVFVPVFNVDGHERFGTNHRPNQRGPVEMGWRTTAQNYNLNRDYAKADSPEMQAMIRLLVAYDPVLYVDLHVTNGADFQHDIAVMVDPADVGPETLRAHGRALRDRVLDALSKRGHKPLPFYPAFEKDDDPASGFGIGVAPPRFAHGYWAARDRIAVLVETHSWKPYATRVEATRKTVVAIAVEARANATKWREAADALDASSIAGAPVHLRYENTGRKRELDFLAYAYRRQPSAISGALKISYDPTKPITMKVPFLDELAPKLTVAAPKAGYLLPPSATLAIERLALHGLRFERLPSALTLDAKVHRATKVELGASSYEGRQTLSVTGAWGSERVDVAANSIFVPIHQPAARLLVHLLEPGAPDALLSWGFFNAHYEEKEYLEPYVAEVFAEQLLAKDPKVRAEFEQRLEDPKFAADPSARLDFFYMRHPSWDRNYRRYPVLRLEAPPPQRP